MKAETLAVISTLSGAVVGWFLSALQHWVESSRDRRRTHANVRRLITLEIQANGRALRAFWEHIESHKDEWQKADGEINRFRLGKAIADTPFPELGTFMWFSNAALLGEAYSGTEIEDFWETYADCSLVANLYQHIVNSDAHAVESSQHHIQTMGRAGVTIGGMVFQRKAADHIETFRVTIERLIRKLCKN